MKWPSVEAKSSKSPVCARLKNGQVLTEKDSSLEERMDFLYKNVVPHLFKFWIKYCQFILYPLWRFTNKHSHAERVQNVLLKSPPIISNNFDWQSCLYVHTQLNNSLQNKNHSSIRGKLASIILVQYHAKMWIDSNMPYVSENDPSVVVSIGQDVSRDITYHILNFKTK